MEDVVIAGRMAAHPHALELAREVRRVHHRYAVEVVARYKLCPFMGDPTTAFGRFVVMLDSELDVTSACKQATTQDEQQLAHLIYPLIACQSLTFERFAARLHVEVRDAAVAMGRKPPVHAAFHPDMEGDGTSAARLVGVLRHAPDPFIQFVPEGLQKGGSTFIDPKTIDLAALAAEMKAKPATTFERVVPDQIDELLAALSDIRADRDRSYARFLHAIA